MHWPCAGLPNRTGPALMAAPASCNLRQCRWRPIRALSPPSARHGLPAMFRIVLVHPEIPPTPVMSSGWLPTQAASCTIEPLGFSMEDKHMRRAGLDYHEYADVRRHASWKIFLRDCQPDPARMFHLTTKATQSFGGKPGKRATGSSLAAKARAAHPVAREQLSPEQGLRLPMRPGQRSLNLSNAVAVVVLDAWRQHGYADGH